MFLTLVTGPGSFTRWGRTGGEESDVDDDMDNDDEDDDTDGPVREYVEEDIEDFHIHSRPPCARSRVPSVPRAVSNRCRIPSSNPTVTCFHHPEWD